MARNAIRSLFRDLAEFASPGKSVKGHVDGYSGGRLKGWAINARQLGEPVDLAILVDGRQVLALTADAFRRDLKQAGYSSGWNGFSVALPKSVMDGGSHRISVVTARGRHHLGGSPLTVYLPFVEPWSVIRFADGEIGLSATDGPILRGTVRFDDEGRPPGIGLLVEGPGGWSAEARSDRKTGRFSIPLPSTLAPDGEEITLRLSEIARDRPVWQVDLAWSMHRFDYGCTGINNNELEGWLRDLDAPTEVCTFDLIVDGHPVSSEICDRREIIDGETRWCGFAAAISDRWADDVTHGIQMRIHGTDLVVPRDPWLLYYGDTADRPHVITEWAPDGSLEGWAYSQVARDATFRAVLDTGERRIPATPVADEHPGMRVVGVSLQGGFRFPPDQAAAIGPGTRLLVGRSDKPAGKQTRGAQEIEVPPPARWPDGVPFATSWSAFSGTAVVLQSELGSPFDTREADWAMLAIAMRCLRAGEEVVLVLPEREPKLESLLVFLEIWRRKGSPGALRVVDLPPLAVAASLLDSPLIAQRLDLWARQQNFERIYAPAVGGALSHAIDARAQGLGHAGTWLELVVTRLSGPSRLAYHEFPEDLVDLFNDNLEIVGLERAAGVTFANRVLEEHAKRAGVSLSGKVRVRCMPWSEIDLGDGPGFAGAGESPAALLPDDGKPVLVYCAPLSAGHGLTAVCDMLDIARRSFGQQLEACRVVFIGPPGRVFQQSALDFLEARSERWRFDMSVVETDTLDEAMRQLRGVAGRPLWICIDDDICGRVDRLRRDLGWPALAVRDGRDQRDPVVLEGIASSPRDAADRIVRWLRGEEFEGLGDPEPEWQPLNVDEAAGPDDAPDRAVPDRAAPGRAAAPPAVSSPFAAVRPSLCITHFNRVATLRQLLDSLEVQRDRIADIIVVDDGTAYPGMLRELDEIESRLERHGGKLIRSVNSYPGAARNLAVANATGDWIVFMDDDNLAMPNMVDEFCSAQHATGADVLTCVYYGFDANRLIDVTRSVPELLMCPQGPDKGTGVLANVFGDANLMISRRAFEAVGGFTEIYGRGHEDWEFLARLVLSGFKVERILEPLFWYRMNPGGMSAQRPDPSMNLARGLSAYRDHVDPSIYRLLELTNGWYWG